MRRQWLYNRGVRTNQGSYPISTGAPSVDVPDTIPDLFAWYRGDLGVTLNGSNVSAWADQSLPALDISQGVAGNQPPWVESNGNLNGQSHIGPFDGTADHFTIGAASDWEFLHNGTGMTIGIVFHTGALGAIRRLLDNTNGSGTALGLTLQVSAASPALAWLNVGNGTAAVLSVTTAASINANSSYGMIIRHDTTRTPDCRISINGVETTGNNSNTPGTGPAAATLNVGRRSGALQYFNGSIAELMFWDRYIEDSEATTVSDYVIARYF